jgi:hypothetical protein
MKRKIPILMVLLSFARFGYAQGFINLDFEKAKIVSSDGLQTFVTNAFPGWTVTAPYITYDAVSLSGGSVSIFDTNPPSNFPPIQGKYYVFFQGVNSSAGPTASIGQTGEIPITAQSISFWGTIGGLQITFAGQPLSFNAVSSSANCTVYDADISAYAGQTGQLLFTLPPNSFNAALDNIQFSSSPVPEPGELALAAMGALLFGCRRWRSL